MKTTEVIIRKTTFTLGMSIRFPHGYTIEMGPCRYQDSHQFFLVRTENGNELVEYDAAPRNGGTEINRTHIPAGSKWTRGYATQDSQWESVEDLQP